MTTHLERRMAHLISAGVRFTADDLTADGHVTLDQTHTPNARQNGIGALFNQAARRGLIEWTGNVVRSRAPHRKGGMNREWLGTEAGQLWARNIIR